MDFQSTTLNEKEDSHRSRLIDGASSPMDRWTGVSVRTTDCRSRLLEVREARRVESLSLDTRDRPLRILCRSWIDLVPILNRSWI